jgi:hypothetical protein
MIDVGIKNGTGISARISQDGELRTIGSPYPPFEEQKVQPFRQYLTDDGTETGSNDMGVDGSVTNVEFYIPSSPNNDRYITSLSFIVGYGAAAQPNQWADVPALTNGSELYYLNRNGVRDIHDGIKSNQDMFRLSSNAVPTLWEVRHVNANNDYGYFIVMDLAKTGLPFGIKLDAASTQKLGCKIRDNATDADSFNCIAYGFERFE